MKRRSNGHAESSFFKRTKVETKAEIIAEGATTIDDACEFSSISRSSLYELMDAGKLACVTHTIFGLCSLSLLNELNPCCKVTVN